MIPRMATGVHGRSLILLLLLSLGSLLSSAPVLAAGDCGGAHARLAGKERKKLEDSWKSFSKSWKKLLKYEKSLARDEKKLAAGQAELALAEELPEDTRKQRKAKRAALDRANSKINKATRGITRWSGKAALRQARIDQLVPQITALDPWRFTGPGYLPADPAQQQPAWANVVPLRVIELEYDSAQSDTQNGARLKAAVQALLPGDQLVVGAGTWSVDSYFGVSLVGSAAAPIRVVAARGAKPVITRPDAAQNLMNLGGGAEGSAQYLCFRGLVFRGGSAGIRIYGGRHLWLDHCEIRDTGDAALTTNTVNTEFLHITRNHIHHTSGYGEGMYLGANGGAVTMRFAVVAGNHVHDTGGHQGDGIELKQGSYGNWLVGNCVHDTNYPCILVYGTNGQARNVIERNHCVGSNDNVMQVQGEAIVRNNLVVGGANAFFSTDHQGSSTDLEVVHNTFVSEGIAAYLSSWNGRPNMLFANNVAYSGSSVGLTFSAGSTGVSAAGNVVFGGAIYAPENSYTVGAGLPDFARVLFDASRVDARPDPEGSLVGAGDPAHSTALDLSGAARTGSLEAGCLDSP